MKHTRTAATVAALGLTTVFLAACSSPASSPDSGVSQDTSITIDGTLTGDESVTLGDIDTGSGNGGTE